MYLKVNIKEQWLEIAIDATILWIAIRLLLPA
jgi:hypothetical protein